MARRPLEAWLLPAMLCSDRVPHPPHECVVDDGYEEELVWCRGRMPFTVEAARAGAELVATMRQVEAWRDMCERTAAGRQFLLSMVWLNRVARIQADEQLARVEKRATPWWLRWAGQRR